MVRASLTTSLIVIVALAAFVTAASADKLETCQKVRASCDSKCDNIANSVGDPSKLSDAELEAVIQKAAACYDVCASVGGLCMEPGYGESSNAGNALPPGTTGTPPNKVGVTPPNPVGVEQPPGSTPPPKLGLQPPGQVGTQPTSGGSGTPPPGLTGVHPVFPVKPNPVGVNQPGTGTTGNGSGEQIYTKSGAGQQNVQELIKSWKQKVNDKNSGLYTGATQREAGSVSPKVKSQIFNQTNQTSMHMGSAKQKLQTEMLHLDKEKSNVQNSGSVSGSSNLPAAGQHHGRNR